MMKFQKKIYNWIVVISIDSVMIMDKKNYAPVYLAECKCDIKKKKDDQIY